MANLAIDVLRRLYVDEDGFTMEDCKNYLQIVSGAPLGDEQKATRNNQCAAITEYVRAADDSFVAGTRSAMKLVSTGVPSKVQAALAAMDWKQALRERFPFLLEKLTGEEPCDREYCIPYIDDVAKLGHDGNDAALQLNAIANSGSLFAGSVRAHARVALEKVTQHGNVEERIVELAKIIVIPGWNQQRDDLANEAAVYASFPQYTESVKKAFAPLLPDRRTFESAVTAIAGGEKRSKDMITQILVAIPKIDERSPYFDGDLFSREFEKIAGYDAAKKNKGDLWLGMLLLVRIIVMSS